MRIIPDDTKITYLVDSYPDTPEDADYLEVSERDTIEITDDEWDEIFSEYYQQFENSRYTSDGVVHIMANQFAQYLRELIELKG